MNETAYFVVDYQRREVHLVKRSRELAIRLARELGGEVYEVTDAEVRLLAA